jgi:hypothetical protein
MEMKEFLLFAVPQLLTQFNPSSVLPASHIEEHLKTLFIQDSVAHKQNDHG